VSVSVSVLLSVLRAAAGAHTRIYEMKVHDACTRIYEMKVHVRVHGAEYMVHSTFCTRINSGEAISGEENSGRKLCAKK
jgi:hypothetical protein